MKALDRIRSAVQPPATAVLNQDERAELERAVSALVAHRLRHAIGAVDEAMARVGSHRAAADALLDVRMTLTDVTP